MEKCVWVRLELLARIESLEWTESHHLRHSKFAGRSEDKDPRSVVKEHEGEAWVNMLFVNSTSSGEETRNLYRGNHGLCVTRPAVNDARA
jgi:hypothetical protein